jgi:hypothetical protein
LYGVLVCLILVLVSIGDRAFAQETAISPEPVLAIASPLPSQQERILAPIPEQFDWIHREVRPNPLLEALLTLQEGPPQLFMSVTLVEEYSDNFSQAQGGGEEEYRTTVDIGTVYRLESGRSFVSLANTIDANYDARAEEGDFGFVNLALNAGHQLQRLTLALSESFIRDDDPGQADLSGIRRMRRTFLRNRVSPQMRYAFSRLTSMDLAYTNTIVVSQGGVSGDDSITHDVTTGVQHRFTRVLTGSVNYTFTADDSDGAADTQAHDASADLTYIFERRTSLVLEAFGTITDRRNGGTNSQSYGGSIGLRRQLTPFLSAFVSIGATVFDEEDDDSDVRLNWQVNLEGDLPVFRTRRTTLSLTTGQSVDDTTGDVDSVGVVLNTSVTLSLNHAASRFLVTSVFVSFTRTELLEDPVGTSEAVQDREDNFWRAGARASYALTRVLSLSLAYLYQRRDSNLAGNDFDENQVTLTLSGNFSVL